MATSGLPTRVARTVLTHHLNHGCELVLPRAATVADEPRLSPTPSYYWHVSGPLVELLSPSFIDTHVRSGILLALSATAADQAGSLAITHPGKLLIVCERHLYECLGLPGLPSSSSPDKARWCVLVDLLSEHVAPGGRDHKRVTAALRRLADVQLLLVWQPAAGAAATEPAFPAGVRATRHEVVASRREYAQLAVPDLRGLVRAPATAADAQEADDEVASASWGGGQLDVAAERHGAGANEGEEEDGDGDGDEGEQEDEQMYNGGGGDGMAVDDAADEPAVPTAAGEEAEEEAAEAEEEAEAEAALERSAAVAELHEWLGMVALDLRAGLYSAPAAVDDPSSGLSALRLHSLPLVPPAAPADGCRALRWRGMLAPSAVHGLLAQAAALVSRGDVAWAALTVWGFVDAPVSWGLREHQVALAAGAENDYTVVLLPGGRCLLRLAASGRTEDAVCEGTFT